MGFAISIKKCDVVVEKEINEKMNHKDSRATERVYFHIKRKKNKKKFSCNNLLCSETF